LKVLKADLASSGWGTARSMRSIGDAGVEDPRRLERDEWDHVVSSGLLRACLVSRPRRG
jgi:hypothetical protein